MHFAGIIIKEKSIDVVQARTTLGDVLVERGLSDWYSTDDYRERTFDGKREISLEDFKIVWEEWKKDNYDGMPLIVIENMSDDEDDIDIDIVESYLSHDFYEFEKTYRDKLTALYNEAYFSSIDELLNDLDKDKYNVCLLDYHN